MPNNDVEEKISKISKKQKDSLSKSAGKKYENQLEEIKGAVRYIGEGNS